MRFSVLAMLFATAFAAAPTLPPLDVADALRQVPVALVMAHGAECDACPEFEAVESDVPTYLVDASADEAAQFRDAYGITSFPAFLLLEHGALAEKYNGHHSRAAIEAYLLAKTREAPSVASEL
jgi:hypothetical protein